MSTHWDFHIKRMEIAWELANYAITKHSNGVDRMDDQAKAKYFSDLESSIEWAKDAVNKSFPFPTSDERPRVNP